MPNARQYNAIFSMTKCETEKLLADFFAQFGKADFVFEEKDFVKTNIGEAVLGFEFNPREQNLACYALIYRFHNAPLPQILREIEIAEKNGADTGGGMVIFDAEQLTISLVRFYSIAVEPLLFAAQMQKLAAASLTWSGTIINRVATKAVGN